MACRQEPAGSLAGDPVSARADRRHGGRDLAILEHAGDDPRCLRGEGRGHSQGGVLNLRLTSRLAALLALAPAFAVFFVVYIGATGWTIWISLTNSRMLPSSVFVGLRQYESLFTNERWLVSVHNLIIFGVLFVAVSIALGFALAI